MICVHPSGKGMGAGVEGFRMGVLGAGCAGVPAGVMAPAAMGGLGHHEGTQRCGGPRAQQRLRQGSFARHRVDLGRMRYLSTFHVQSGKAFYVVETCIHGEPEGFLMFKFEKT